MPGSAPTAVLSRLRWGIGMSIASDCGPCLNGDHAHHDRDHGIREGVIGGTYCACTGDCAERSERADDIWPKTTASRWCAKHNEEDAECWSGHYCAWSASRMPHTEHGYCVGYLPHLAVGLRNLMDHEPSDANRAPVCTHNQAEGVPERSVADSPTGAPSADDLIDALRAERNSALMERDEWESNYLTEMRDHDRTKQLLRHSQRVAGKAIQRGVDTRPPPRPIPGSPVGGVGMFELLWRTVRRWRDAR